MRKLYVSIEMNGEQVPVGLITGNSGYSAVFQYAPDYLAYPEAQPISISLPLQTEPFSSEKTRIFFEGLLPEGFLRRTVAENNRTDHTDYLTLLELLGEECLGAVQIRSENILSSPPEYRELRQDVLEQIAAEGALKSAELVVKAHLSLTGASGKIGVYRSGNGQWYLPVGSAPSTHILKQSHIRFKEIVQNEYLCMMTAQRLGIKVPASMLVPFKNTDDREMILFATERYDRVLSSSKTISGMPCPMRLHQEDFGQALGIGASEKYERGNEHQMRQMFELLRQRSSNPITDQLQLWDMIVLHALIGNTDGHIKNFSLLYDPSLHSIRLAPAYDIISTVIYDQHSTQMAFAIGGEIEWTAIRRSCFEAATKEIRLNTSLFMRRYDYLASHYESALRDSAAAMTADGFPEADELAENILKKTLR